MTTKQLATILLLLCSIFMITANLNRGFADEEQGSSGGDSGGGGSNDGGGDNNGGDSGGSDNNEDKSDSDTGGKDSDSSDDGKDDSGSSSDSKQEETPSTDNVDSSKTITQKEADNNDLKGTPEEQEKAAVEDYIHEEPGIVKPYPYVSKYKPVTKEPFNCKDGKWTKGCVKIHPNPIKCKSGWDKDCKSPLPQGPGPHPKCDNHGYTHECHHPPHHPWKGKHWCDWHKCNDDHHKHNHHNDHSHYDKVTKNYYYDYNNDYNNNHATVILQPDYSHTNNYHDIRVVIGDSNEFDTVINFAGKPDNLVVTGLDISEGETFDTCMKNLNDGDTNCVTSHLQDEDKAVYVDIRLP